MLADDGSACSQFPPFPHLAVFRRPISLYVADGFWLTLAWRMLCTRLGEGTVMNGAAWLLALATLGVDYGWRLDDRGQLEYIIQIPPSQLETLRESPEGISSAIPPEVVRHVKRFRIVVG